MQFLLQSCIESILRTVLVIGAHWDTYGMSPGFNDNGSGVAAILEIARILASATCYRVGENITYISFRQKMARLIP